MVTDDERRRAAAALRECLDGRVCLHNWWETLLETVAEAVGMTADDNPTAQDLCDRLADLIDPDTTKSQTIGLSSSLCDRDALLGLADRLDIVGAIDADCEIVVSAETFLWFARRIRKACGVSCDAE